MDNHTFIPQLWLGMYARSYGVHCLAILQTTYVGSLIVQVDKSWYYDIIRLNNP